MATNQDINAITASKAQPQAANDKKSSKNTNDLKQQQHQQQNEPAEDVSKPPKPPKSETIRSLLLLSLAIMDTYMLPGPTRSTILETVNARPVLTSFLAAQIAVALFPLLLFTTGILTAGVVAAGLVACLGMVVLVPVLLVTSVLGVVIWGWGWALFMAARWSWGVYVERKLGGPPTAVAVQSDSNGSAGGAGNGNTGNGNTGSDNAGNGGGEGPLVVKSETVGVNASGARPRTNGETGKKWQFKAGFGDKWMVLG